MTLPSVKRPAVQRPTGSSTTIFLNLQRQLIWRTPPNLELIEIPMWLRPIVRIILLSLAANILIRAATTILLRENSLHQFQDSTSWMLVLSYPAVLARPGYGGRSSR